MSNDAKAIYGELFAYLRGVRLAGGWREYVVEQRRSLAVLRALWMRRHSRAPVVSSRADALVKSMTTSRMPSDVALVSMVFDRLPAVIGDKILRSYTELLFF